MSFLKRMVNNSQKHIEKYLHARLPNRQVVLTKAYSGAGILGVFVILYIV